jgi:hypothetical protein
MEAQNRKLVQRPCCHGCQFGGGSGADVREFKIVLQVIQQAQEA